MIDPNEIEWKPMVIPARADSGNSGNSGASGGEAVQSPELAIKPESDAEDPGPTGVTGVESPTRDRLETSLRRLKDAWTPPDIVRHNRPSLQQVIAHAWAGDWGPKEGFWRTAGKIDAVLISIPLVAFFYYCAWVVERPQRRLCAIVLLSVIAWAFSLWWWMS